MSEEEEYFVATLNTPLAKQRFQKNILALIYTRKSELLAPAWVREQPPRGEG